MTSKVVLLPIELKEAGLLSGSPQREHVLLDNFISYVYNISLDGYLNMVLMHQHQQNMPHHHITLAVQ